MTEPVNPFFDKPILNSPYGYPGSHWELDDKGQPTQQIVHRRRLAEFVTPIPKPRGVAQQRLAIEDDEGLSNDSQRYEIARINAVRQQVDAWRRLPMSQWRVTPETARLLDHWRNHTFASIRPFFCQVEAVETLIWLTEVAPQTGKLGEQILSELAAANTEANPGLNRLALKLATGAGKTTVMAMVIAWQTINAVRRPQSSRFTRGFLIITPGITIKDRLRVLQPNDPDSYYQSRELVPADLMDEIHKAKIVITNYHAFKLRERTDISKGGRALLQGRGDALDTRESEGQMIQRVMPELMGMKNLFVLNDEAHHCYREKPQPDNDATTLTAEDKEEAKKNSEAARLWISGIEAVNRKLGVVRVADLSATPFFLRGSGYAEGTLFPWTMSDFSLMDAIECGIVKLPRVPVSNNIPGDEAPIFRNLWKHIGKKMPKKGRSKAGALSVADVPPLLQTALDALYGHYKQTFELWQQEGISVPPCFIVVCNNTAASKLVYDFMAGCHPLRADGSTEYESGRFPLFRNYDDNGDALPRPNTLLIDSEQLESGEALDDSFRRVAGPEIEQFRREVLERGGPLAEEIRSGKDFDEARLLREVMNTVGKAGRLGGSIRCVVSVSMLTEGWDANTVTHVLGVRAFGTQLLCEQVIGRALRRQSYDLNEEGLFNVEYADVLGIPFDFTAKPVIAKPQPPRETVHVKAVRPERDHLEIRFPRVQGYRVDLPKEELSALFTQDSILELTPQLVGPTQTENAGIIGQPVELNLVHTGAVRPSQVLYDLTSHLLLTKFRDANGDPRLFLFGQLKRIVKQWIDGYLKCTAGTYPAQLKYKMLADMACNKIVAAITSAFVGKRPIEAVLDPYNPEGSSALVNFTTSSPLRYATAPHRSHVNWAILDSSWETEFCKVAEKHPRVKAYVRNSGLGFEVPYRYGPETRRYLPDFIVLVDDGHGEDDLLHLVVEIKGYRGTDAPIKKETMDVYWVPGVNNLKAFGRWAFAEFTDIYTLADDFAATVEGRFEAMMADVVERAARERV
jgi:type III restriction enzyme